MNVGADRWIRWTSIGCVAQLALIAGTVSYLHMHMPITQHGQPGRVAALTPLSVDGMIVAASTTLLADSRSGRKGEVLPTVQSLVDRRVRGPSPSEQVVRGPPDWPAQVTMCA